MALSLNVHAYDGKLTHLLNSDVLRTHLVKVKGVDTETKRKMFERLRGSIVTRDSPVDVPRNFDIISSQEMLDPVNKVGVFDLLYIVGELVFDIPEGSDVIPVLQTQLVDMSTGLCVQGRTTRLLQTIMPFHDRLHVSTHL
jgi:hypothetical protein